MRSKQFVLKPVITEKSTKQAEGGKYTFLVSPILTKDQARSLLNDMYGVKTGAIRSDLQHVKTKRAFRGGKWVRAKYQRKTKKVIVELTEGKDKLAKLFKL